MSQLRKEQAESQRSMSQMLGVWFQELSNAVKPQNSTGKPSELEKQLQRLTIALSTFNVQQMQLKDSITSLSERLED